MTDYTTLSGAEFKRAVGVDPEKWAEAFEQRSQRSIAGDEAWLRTHEQRVEYIASWFRDAMEAAVKATEPPSVDWDKLRDRLNVTLNEHGLPGLRKPSD